MMWFPSFRGPITGNESEVNIFTDNEHPERNKTEPLSILILKIEEVPSVSLKLQDER